MESLLSLFKFLFILLEVVVLFNLLIIVHELGHFLAARWRGLKVERFGVWFGKPLWQREFGGVKYSLGSIPAGGFVALPQMAPMEALEGKSDVSYKDLPPIGALDKIIVAFAGPVFSFGLAFAFALIVWKVGYPRSSGETTTVVGYVKPGSPGERAGILPGDRILEIDSSPVGRWSGIGEDAIVWHVANSAGATLRIRAERRGEVVAIEATPELPSEKTKWYERDNLPQLQIGPQHPSVVGEVKENSPAELAGILPGDRILSVDGIPVHHYGFVSDYLKGKHDGDLRLAVRGEEGEVELTAEEAASYGEETEIVSIQGIRLDPPRSLEQWTESRRKLELELAILREGGEILAVAEPVFPVYLSEIDESEKTLMLGITWAPPEMALAYPGPWEQIRTSVSAMANTIGALFKKDSDIGLGHLSGPVGIGHIYYRLFDSDYGWRLAIWFSVLLNVNLALLNLLPIPVLDGGHIVMATVEGIFRRPIPYAILNYVTNACALLVIGFMLYVTVFDVFDLGTSASEPPEFRFAEPEQAQ